MDTTTPREHPLRRMMAGITEHAFLTDLGVADPPLIDYVTDLLTRFIHADAVYRLRDSAGRPMTELVHMATEAEKLPPDGRTAREYHRHIGDFALFWTGVYPEALRHAHSASPIKGDRFVDYCQQGKRAYYIASTIADDDGAHQQVVLERLSYEFELCAFGLGEVRKEWERRDDGAGGHLVVIV